MTISREQIIELETYHNSTTNFRQSKFYGIDKVIKQYLNLPNWFPLAQIAYLEHGINLNPDKIFKRLQEAKRDLIFLDNQLRVDLLPSNYLAYPLGPPFIHAARIKNLKLNANSKGTLAYPVHSSHNRNFEFDWEVYAKALKALPEFMHPITACVYWMDVLKGRHEVFKDYGIEVVCNGHMMDQDFAINCVQNIARHRYQTANVITSAAFYGIDMGIPFFLHGHDLDLKPTDPEFRERVNQHPFMIRLFEAFTFDRPEAVKLTDAQIRVHQDYLEEDTWISPEKARALAWKQVLPILVSKTIHELVSKLGLKAKDPS